MDLEDDEANPNLTGSSPQSQEVSRISAKNKFKGFSGDQKWT